jgi:hypothetical protein
MKDNNNIWQKDFLKNMNEFNEKILNQEILLDSFEKFEKITEKKIDEIFFEIKNIQLEMLNNKNEVYLFLYFFYIYFIYQNFFAFLIFFRLLIYLMNLMNLGI